MAETRSDSTGAAARKWHTKSRTGCQSCKARKVKCDEHHPSCRNCIKRGIKCDFLKYEDSSPTPISSPPASLELELLHNFTIATASTLATEPQVRDLWRILVPQIGFTTRYIMDGILALSALHMARYNPGRRELLLSQATHYHTASLKEALPLIPSITPQNSSHLFLFGVLTLFTNLASPIKEDDMLIVGNGFIPEWLFLFRGIDTMIHAEEEAIESTAVSLIFRSTDPSGDFWTSHTPAENKILSDFENGMRARTANNKEKQEALLQAIDCLKRSYTFLNSKQFADEDKLRGFYQWLCEVGDGYLKLLRETESEALCVMAFFAVLLRDLEKYWWIEGWGVHLIKRIYVILDEEYRLCIRWPIEEIGWIPQGRMM